MTGTLHLILVSQCFITTLNAQKSPKLKHFQDHLNKYYFARLEKKLPENSEKYLLILGWFYRLQWDKVLQMPENNEQKARKEYMEELWWDLKKFAEQEGEKSKDVDGKTLFEYINNGFQMRGVFGLDNEEFVKDLSEIDSIFQDNDNKGVLISQDELLGDWVMEATHSSSGEDWFRKRIITFYDKETKYGALKAECSACPVDGTTVHGWKFTEKGTLELMDYYGKIWVELFIENKEYWSGIKIITGIRSEDRKVNIKLCRNKLKYIN